MGLLADIFSYGDGLKRQLGGLLSDPGGTIDLGVQRFKDQQEGLLNAMQSAYPMPGQRSVLVSPQQQDAARSMLADYGSQQGIGAATIWHGSPHKFDAFDAGKIGTGEGAQAYGHGLYFAENSGVANNYATTLSKTDSSGVLGTASRALTSADGDATKARAILESARSTSSPAVQLHIDNAISRLNEAKSANLYKVDLPDEHIAKMLNYDAPVSDAVRGPLSNAAMSQFGTGVTGTSGEHLYKEMVFNFKQAGHANPTQAATDWLSSQGIPGIRYLDGGSRGAGQGTSNYVVFPGNEGLLSILERNGTPIK